MKLQKNAESNVQNICSLGIETFLVFKNGISFI